MIDYEKHKIYYHPFGFVFWGGFFIGAGLTGVLLTLIRMIE